MSIPEPKTFNGAPGEVLGDDNRDGDARTPRIKYECAACGWYAVHAITAKRHADQFGHRMLDFVTRAPVTFPDKTKRSKAS